MRPKNLSASGAQVFENCEARFAAEYIERGRDASGSAADLGSTCHTALELWVKRGFHKPRQPFDVMVKVFDEAFDRNGLTDSSRHKEGLDMVRRWWERTDLDDGREVLSTEEFERFNLRLPSGFTIPWVYVKDRFDQHANGELEIVDYKTVMVPIAPDELRHRVQGKAYAVGAQIKFPQADRIRVTYDLLRHEPVSVVFTKEENREHYRYLQRLGERILSSDGTQETLNEDCRYCVRRHVCGTLQKHLQVGGPLGITDARAAADKYAELVNAKTAIQKLMEDLDPVILNYCEEHEIYEFDTDANHVQVGASRRREVDASRVAAIVGPDLVARYGGFTMGALETLLKGNEISDNQKSALKGIVTLKIGNPTVKVKPKK